jgi:hypothetical protein
MAQTNHFPNCIVWLSSSLSSHSLSASASETHSSTSTRSKRGILGVRPYGIHGACAETIPASGAKSVVYVCLARLHYDSSFDRKGFDTQSTSGAHIFSYPRQFKHLFLLYICLLHIYYITTKSPFTNLRKTPTNIPSRSFFHRLSK